MAAFRRMAAGVPGITEKVSKGVARHLAEIGEFVDDSFRSILPGGEESTGEGGMVAGPEVDGAAMDAAPFGGGGDGGSFDESF